ncbi:MAG: DUF4783 domain-containing protein [Flammeovirgaceae bacterium]|nr:DUF4783 domain-containing protein [Flammeovirgaceae bacterium]
MAQFWPEFTAMKDLRFLMRLVFILMISLLIGPLSYAQHSAFDPIRDVFKTGSSKEVSRYLNASVEINVLGDINTYSKAQAEFVLRDFLKNIQYPIFPLCIRAHQRVGCNLPLAAM